MITAKKIADKYYPDIYMNREYEVEDIRDWLKEANLKLVSVKMKLEREE